MKKLIFIALITISTAVFCYADFKIPQPDNYVNDYANTLNDSQKKQLNDLLHNYDLKTTNQIFVGIFESLEGEQLETLSIRIAEQWRAGKKEKNNGVLLLLFLQEHQVRIEVGYGLEPILTDALTKAVIEKEIVPNFRQKNYYAGIENAAQQIINILSGDSALSQLDEYSSEDKGLNSKIPVLLFILLIFIIINYLFNVLSSGGYSSGGSYPGYGDGFDGGSGGDGFGGGGGSFGGGGASGKW